MKPTLILRHRRENLKKCSLRGLEGKPGFQFYSYPNGELPSLQDYLVLTMDAPLLTKEDASYGLLLIDSLWRYSEKMLRFVEQKASAQGVHLIRRTLPNGYRTAYPRRQLDCSEPDRGLASIEALYIAFHLLQWPTQGLLDHYHWKEPFLQINPSVVANQDNGKQGHL